jgi:rhodanese-related sulfurtransferase
MKNIVPEIFWIVVISATMGIIYNVMTDGLPWIYDPPRGVVVGIPGDNPSSDGVPIDSNNTNTFQMLTYESVQEAIAQKNWIFVDARNAEAYAKGKIGDAINIDPQEDAGNVFPKVFEVVATGKPVIIYCNGVDCDLGHELWEFFKEADYEDKVYIYIGGWDEWIAKNRS